MTKMSVEQSGPSRPLFPVDPRKFMLRGNGLLRTKNFMISMTGGELNIHHESGEGGTFDADLFEKAIEKFYSENF